MSNKGRQADLVAPLMVPPPVQRDWASAGLPETGWVLLFEQPKCDQCRAESKVPGQPCERACADEHHLPLTERISVSLCTQCEPAPCSDVCPVEAVSQTTQGVVEIDQELCIGCNFCVDACPVGALIVLDPYTTEAVPAPSGAYRKGRPAGELPRTVAKCTLCSYRLEDRHLPICVEACPVEAIWVGSLDRNTVVNRNQAKRLTDLLADRSWVAAAPGRRVIYLQG